MSRNFGIHHSPAGLMATNRPAQLAAASQRGPFYSSHERSWFGAIYALLGVLSIALVFVGALYLFEVP